MTSIFIDYLKQILIINVKKLFHCFVCFVLKKIRKFEKIQFIKNANLCTYKKINFEKKKLNFELK